MALGLTVHQNRMQIQTVQQERNEKKQGAKTTENRSLPVGLLFGINIYYWDRVVDTLGTI